LRRGETGRPRSPFGGAQSGRSRRFSLQVWILFGGTQMRSFVTQIARFRATRFRASTIAERFRGCVPCVTLSVLLSGMMGWDRGEAADPVNSDVLTVETFVESQKLRMEARLAAEQGDFQTAAQQLKAAARRVNDTRTETRVEEAAKSIEAGGGGSLADFSALIQLIRDQTSPAIWEDEETGASRFSTFAQGVFLGAPAAVGALVASQDDSRLYRAAESARTSNKNTDVHAESELRLVSLSRLERHVAELIANGSDIPEDVRQLAGLTEVRYLFRFPETDELVIGGPAGKWSTDADGRIVNAASGRPTLQLDDLITLSRTFSAGGPGFFMCSIDPKQGQVKALNDYLKSNRGKLTAANAASWTETLEKTLGMQNVILQGVPGNSRVAAVIVEADYRMKEIGIGKREGVSGMKSYFDVLTRSERKGSGSAEALRWWMTVAYDSIQVAADHNTYHLTGRNIECLSENQLVNADGKRTSTGKADRANLEFAKLFTEHLPQLAAADPAFADLENVFDLALVSAVIHSRGLARSTEFGTTCFSAGGAYAAAEVAVPQELMTAAQSRVYSGGDVVIQVAGGVRGDLRRIVGDAERFVETPALREDAAAASPAGQPGSRWWWDARNTD